MSDNDQNTDQQQNSIQSEDLDLLDTSLEDDGKDDAALWAELERTDAAASDDDDGLLPDDDDAANFDDDAGTGKHTDDDQAAADKDTQKSAAKRKQDGDDASASDDQSDELSSDGQQTQDNDVWAEATPEQQAAHKAATKEIERLKQADRSNRGRLSALQRQIDEIRNGNQAAKPAAGAKSEDGDNDYFVSDEWKHLEEEFPEISAPVSNIVRALQRQVTDQNRELSAIRNDRRQSALDEQEAILNEQHADWYDVMTAQPKKLVDWLESQPRHIKEAAVRNADAIVDAAEAADVVGRFKDFLSGGKSKGSADTSRQDAQGGGRGKQNLSSGKRERQLESASSTRSRGPGAASGIPEDGDPQALWDQFDKMEARQTRG